VTSFSRKRAIAPSTKFVAKIRVLQILSFASFALDCRREAELSIDLLSLKLRNVAEVKKEIQFEVAHVLFTDIVGYSKLLTNEQPFSLNEQRENQLPIGDLALTDVGLGDKAVA
jgi:hypothetical protein